MTSWKRYTGFLVALLVKITGHSKCSGPSENVKIWQKYILTKAQNMNTSLYETDQSICPCMDAKASKQLCVFMYLHSATLD